MWLKHVLLCGVYIYIYIILNICKGRELFLLKVWFSYVFIICYCTSKDFLSNIHRVIDIDKEFRNADRICQKQHVFAFFLWYARNSPIGASGFVMPDILYILFAYCSSCSKFALVVSI